MNKEDIKLFLKNEDIVENKSVISAYTLYEILNNFFEDFRFARYGDSQLINRMNSEYTFRDRLKTKGIDNAWFRKIFITKFNDKIIDIIIVVNPLYRTGKEGRGNIYFHLIKDRLTGNIYFKDHELCNKVFDKFYPEIIKIFDTADKYIDIFMLDKKEFSIYYQVFKENDISVLMEYNNFGSVYYHFINSRFYNDDTFDFIKEYSSDVLKKIPVPIDNLDTISGHIVNEYMKRIRKLDK